MNAPSIDIASMLEAYNESSGFSLVFGTDLFIGQQPSKPDCCVTIFDTPGFAPALALKNQGYQYPSIQILVRDINYIAGWDLINEIMTALHGRNHETWGGTLYTVIQCSSGPALLEYDDDGRANFIINFNVQRR